MQRWVSLGLLSFKNRDQHTSRSLEIPYIGSVLCAQRTLEHQRMYREGEEALFWSNSHECIEICQSYLNNKDKLTAIAKAGQQKVKKLGVSNRELVQSVLEYF